MHPTSAGAEIVKPPEWHALVAWDLFFNNVTTGLYLATAVGEFVAPKALGPVARLAYPIALAVLLADLLCLVLDLGDPLRFHHMLRVFKPRSPMSLGTWCLSTYSLPLTLIVLLDVWPGAWEATRSLRLVAVVAGLVPAFGSAVYKGVLFSTTAQPAWRDARWLGGYLVNTAIMLGCGVLLVLALAMGRAEASAVLGPAFRVLLVLNLVALGLLIADIAPAVRPLDPDGTRRRVGALVVASTALVLLALTFAGEGAVPRSVAVLGVALASLSVRFAIVKLPHAHTDRPAP